MADGLTDDRLVLDIGGVVCQVLLPDATWHAALAARYAPFLGPTRPDWRIDVRLDPALTDGGIDSIEHTGAITRFRVAAYAGSIDLDNQQAFVSTPTEARAASAIERVWQVVARYQAAFGALPELEVPTEHADVESAWHLYNLRLNLGRWTIHRAQFIEELKALNIGASVHFIPLHMQPYYADKYGYQFADFPVAHREYMRLVSLPLHPRLSDQDVTDVIEAVTRLVEKYRK